MKIQLSTRQGLPVHHVNIAKLETESSLSLPGFDQFLDVLEISAFSTADWFPVGAQRQRDLFDPMFHMSFAAVPAADFGATMVCGF